MGTDDIQSRSNDELQALSRLGRAAWHYRKAIWSLAGIMLVGAMSWMTRHALAISEMQTKVEKMEVKVEEHEKVLNRLDRRIDFLYRKGGGND